MRKKLPPPGSRAICLARYSSDLQNPKSADDQIREAMAYCERHGWEVVATHKDEALTGRTVVGRNGFYQTMAAAEAGECDVIVIEDISRFARDAADTMIAARKLDENDVVICTVSGGIMTGLELVIRAQMAQEQSEEMAYRVSGVKGVPPLAGAWWAMWRMAIARSKRRAKTAPTVRSMRSRPRSSAASSKTSPPGSAVMRFARP